MMRQACSRPLFRLIFVAAIVVSFAPLSVNAGNHEAMRTDATWTSTQTDVLDPGVEWVDEAGIYHLRGLTELDDMTGDITGTGIVVINIDFFAPGECTEVACPGYTEVWGTVDIDGESGRWTGRFMQSLSDVPDDEFAFTSIAVHGRGGYGGMSFYGEFVDSAETSVTLAGTLSTMATPIEALDVDVTVCFTANGVSGNYIGSGAVDGFGHAEGVFLGSGGPWTHTYNLFGLVELSNDSGSVTLGFVVGAQDTGYTSHGFGNFVVTGGSGAYEQLYGHGRVTGAAREMPRCESGFGVSLSLIGEAHFN